MRLRAAFLALALGAVSGFGATAETQLSADFDSPTDRYGHGAVAEWAGLENKMTVDRPGTTPLPEPPQGSVGWT
nr:hypothetical protein [uncultured Celeribacter sp.]